MRTGRLCVRVRAAWHGSKLAAHRLCRHSRCRPTGRAEGGKRLVGAVPFGKWPIAGLRWAGTTAPAVFEGAISGEMFPLPGMATEQSR